MVCGLARKPKAVSRWGQDGIFSYLRLNLEEECAAPAAELVQSLQQSLGRLLIGPVYDGPFGHVGDGPRTQGAEQHLGTGLPLALILDGHASDLPAESLLQLAPLARLQDVASRRCGHEGVPIPFANVAGEVNSQP